MKELTFTLAPTDEASNVFTTIALYLESMSLRATSTDFDRPWGGFFVIDEAQTAEFIAEYFPELPREQIERGANLTPKILVVAPGKRLSWQYHHRREELWRVVSGPVGVVTSTSDEQGPTNPVQSGETVQFGTEVRHRLVGLDNWGIVAEIWQHTDPANPSDESDIIRVEDDFSRT